jgi:hypothetical protein
MLVVFRRRRPPPLSRSESEWKRDGPRKKSSVHIALPPEPGIVDEDLSELVVRAAACNLTLLTRLVHHDIYPSTHCLTWAPIK